MSADLEYPSLDDVREAAASVLHCAPGAVPFRDEGAADSALHTIQPVYGHDPYLDVPTKTAVLLYRLARNHPLADGNKRTSTLVAIAFEPSRRRSGASSPGDGRLAFDRELLAVPDDSLSVAEFRRAEVQGGHGLTLEVVDPESVRVVVVDRLEVQIEGEDGRSSEHASRLSVRTHFCRLTLTR